MISTQKMKMDVMDYKDMLNDLLQKMKMQISWI